MRPAVLCVALVLFLGATGAAETYSSVGSVFDLGLGARPLAMGGAFVGVADDGSSLLYNAAGLSWISGISVLSSYEARPGIAGYGNVSVSLSHLGCGVSYFDFGEVPETDEFGNVIGTFSYRNYALVASAGIRASEIPGLGRMPFAANIGMGVTMKVLKASSTEPGSGSGMVFDVPLLLRTEIPASGLPFISGYSVGLVLKNAVGVPIVYGSGHQEDWPRDLVLGTSIEFLDQLTLAVDMTSSSLCLGAEWRPVPALSLRGGLRHDGVWMETLGLGLKLSGFTFDFALVLHPYLSGQVRGSLTLSW